MSCELSTARKVSLVKLKAKPHDSFDCAPLEITYSSPGIRQIYDSYRNQASRWLFEYIQTINRNGNFQLANDIL